MIRASLIALTVAVSLGLAATAAADSTVAEVPISELPGYFDVDALGIFDRDDLELRVSVHGVLLQLVATTSEDNEPEMARALRGLRGVDVRAYNVAETERGRVREAIDATAERLTRQGWATALTVQVKRDHGYAFLRMVDGTARGLAAMYVTDDNQAVFVNIVGRLDTDALARLAQRFQLDHLEVQPPADAEASTSPDN